MIIGFWALLMRRRKKRNSKYIFDIIKHWLIFQIDWNLGESKSRRYKFNVSLNEQRKHTHTHKPSRTIIVICKIVHWFNGKFMTSSPLYYKMKVSHRSESDAIHHLNDFFAPDLPFLGMKRIVFMFVDYWLLW